MQTLQSQMVKLSQVVGNNGQIEGLPKNPRVLRDEKFERLKQSIVDNPEMMALRELLLYPHGGKYVVIGGNMRLQALKALGYKEAPAKLIPAETTVEQLKAYTIKDNASFGEWDWNELGNVWDAAELNTFGLDVWQDINPEEGFLAPAGGGSPAEGTTTPEEDLQPELGVKTQNQGSMAAKYLVPPFTILDMRQGYWIRRKKEWLARLPHIGDSREAKMFKAESVRYHQIYKESMAQRAALGITFGEYLEKYVTPEKKANAEKSNIHKGISCFDPVLSELICKWFTPHAGSKIFDPFAGDIAKGGVFGYCGHEFTGIELRHEQVEINEKALQECGEELANVKYICDDGQNVANHFEPESQDLLMSCPPYFDLERYSKLENDASNQDTYEDFIKIIENGFAGAYGCLKQDRFIVIVVGDVRSKIDGCYYDFTGDIKRIFKNLGAQLYNEMILVEPIGAGLLRAGANMRSRKVTKVHQNVLVFFKGDPNTIITNFPDMAAEYDEFVGDQLEELSIHGEDEDEDGAAGVENTEDVQ